MAQITRSPDCGHSPKNRLLEELAIARVTNDSATLDRLLSDNISWTIVGRPSIEGKSSVLDAMQKHYSTSLLDVAIRHVTQHGKFGAVNGTLTLRSGQKIEFCDMCEFANTKGTIVVAIATYQIDGSV